MPGRSLHLIIVGLSVLLVTLVLATAELLIPAVNVLLLVLAGLLFGLLIHGTAGFLAIHSPASYRFAYLIVVTILLTTICLGFSYLGSLVTESADEFASQVQAAIRSAQERASESELTKKVLPESFNFKSTVLQHAGSAC